MRHPKTNLKSQFKETRFPPSVFITYLSVLLLMSGIHTGLIVLMNARGFNEIVQSAIPVLYWLLVAVGLTLFTRQKIRKTYDAPMKELAKATDQVAHGDFSVFVPPMHTADKQDYLDVMITDFNKMVEELGSIETLKTEFFSNVSHEIKTPLSIIQNHAELIYKDKLTAEERKEYANTILHATKRLSNLIINMLKLSKLEKQTITPLPESYDVCEQLCECALQFEAVWDKKEIEFVAEIEERVMIEADRGLLEMVWANLISNALKFTSASGTVTLTQTSNKDEVTVSVRDTGCGMDDKTIDHIFDKFYQGDASHFTEGNGLGLSLVQRILELSEGTVTVNSTVGKGTVFTVIIPLIVRKREDTL